MSDSAPSMPYPTLLSGHDPHCLAAMVLAGEPQAETTATDKPWTTFGGIDLHEEIGRGGMGVVYRARQRALDRDVAVKVLLRAQFASREERERFLREAQAAARLQHPGIVAVHEVGEDEGVPWFSMDFIPGRSLEQIVREHPMSARSAAGCVQKVAAAIHHAHENGVLHRDLKPSNILLDAEGDPRITDFGIARIATNETTTNRQAELTRTGQSLGSPGYAAPEQALHGRADTRTDVYGLGSLLYHLLTGRPPFQGPTLDAILMQLRENDPLSPHRLNPAVPRDLETICLQCLRKQPEGRYQSAASVADDLGRFLEGQPILARPLNPISKAWRWMRRHPSIAAMIFAMLLMLAAMIVGVLTFAHHQAQREKRSLLISEARSLTQKRLADSRNDALLALAQAWAIEPSNEIRNEVIACLALPEIGTPRFLPPGSPKSKMPDLTRSADGRFNAAFDEGGEIVVREVKSYREKARLQGHPKNALLKLDDHGTRLAIVAPGSGALKLITLVDGKPYATCQHPQPIRSVDWSGDLIATGCDNSFVYVWDELGRMKHRLSGHEALPVRVSFRPHSQELASTTRDTRVRLWHAARGVEIVRRMTDHRPHTALWWSADGTHLFGGTEEGGAEVFAFHRAPALDVLAPPQEEPHSENLGSASFSADGMSAIVVDEMSCRLWDFRTGRLVKQFPKTAGQWLSALFAANGRNVWLCGWDKELTCYPLSRDTRGNLILGQPSLPCLGHGNLLRAISSNDHHLIMSHNGRGEFIVFTPATGHTLRLSHPGTLAVAISPDNKWVATSSYQKPGIKLWSLADGQQHKILLPDKIVMQLLFTPDGQRLLANTGNGGRCFRTRDWSELPLAPKLRLNNMAVTPDGRYLATLGDSNVILLNASTCQEIARLTLPSHVGWLGDAHLAFDADGSHLLIHTALGSLARWNLKPLSEELQRLGMAMP